VSTVRLDIVEHIKYTENVGHRTEPLGDDRPTPTRPSSGSAAPPKQP
jgi:hypothetical protein